MNDALPVGVTFISSETTQGSYESSSGVWSVGSLAVGEAAVLEIRARVDGGTAGTTITNRAVVAAVDQGDPSPGDDADTAPVVVRSAGGGIGPDDGTAFTGLPGGPGLIAWMFGLAMLGVFALMVGGRRRPVVAEAEDREGSRARKGRFRDEPEPFVFTREE